MMKPTFDLQERNKQGMNWCITEHFGTFEETYAAWVEAKKENPEVRFRIHVPGETQPFVLSPHT